jgi:hypothetical protein
LDFGRKEKLNGIMDIERQELQRPEFKFDGKYCGGHKAYPVRKQIKAKFTVFPKRMEIATDRFLLPVRFDQVIDIRNLHQKEIYTVIQYHDGVEEQSPIFDFGKHLEKKQPIIYQKMIAARLERDTKPNREEN